MLGGGGVPPSPFATTAAAADARAADDNGSATATATILRFAAFVASGSRRRWRRCSQGEAPRWVFAAPDVPQRLPRLVRLVNEEAVGRLVAHVVRPGQYVASRHVTRHQFVCIHSAQGWGGHIAVDLARACGGARGGGGGKGQVLFDNTNYVTSRRGRVTRRVHSAQRRGVEIHIAEVW